MHDFIESRLVDKDVPFHNPLKRLKLKTNASDSVIKNGKANTMPLFIYYVKLHMLYPLINALVLET